MAATKFVKDSSTQSNTLAQSNDFKILELQQNILSLRKQILSMRILKCLTLISSRSLYDKRMLTIENDRKHENRILYSNVLASEYSCSDIEHLVTKSKKYLINLESSIEFLTYQVYDDKKENNPILRMKMVKTHSD